MRTEGVRCDHGDMVDDRAPSLTQLIQTGRDLEAARQGAREARASAPDATTVTGGHMDALQQLDVLGPQLGAVVGAVRPDQLDDPTPCDAFTVRDVLRHMIVGATAFAAAYRGEDPPEADLRDPLAAFGPALGGLAAAITAPGALARTIQTPFGPLDGERFARYVVLDGLVHGWDLAIATGAAYEPPDDLVHDADLFAHQMLDPLRDGMSFSDAVEPSADATPIERLVAYTGRRPGTGVHP